MNDIEKLKKLADQDNCNGDCDLKWPYEKCPECKARSVLNEMGEIASAALREIG